MIPPEKMLEGYEFGMTVVFGLLSVFFLVASFFQYRYLRQFKNPRSDERES